MNIDDIKNEIEKLKYHVRMLNDAIDHRDSPVESLVISMDWGQADLNEAHDIFEKYDNKITNEEEINWREFEMELRDNFGIGYQTVKTIIIAFYRNHQWSEVCRGYAMSFEPSTPIEFHFITRGDDGL